MRTIVIKNNTNAPQHIRGLRASDGGQETLFHVMPRARATLKADTFFGLNTLPKAVVLVSDSDATAVSDDYAERKAAANAKDQPKDQPKGYGPKAETK